MIKAVSRHSDSGYIKQLHLDSDDIIEGDLFIDCTGFKALLSEGSLQTGFEDWSHWLPCNRAVAIQSELDGPPPPYTKAIAHKGGWQWRIPLQHRAGNGLVYNSDAYSEDEASQLLLNNIPEKPLADPRPIRFTTGQRKAYWHKNCVAIGLASGFIEPLESTSIHFIQNGIMWLLLMFPEMGIDDATVREYNNKLRTEADHIRDFSVLHYLLNNREGEAFWDSLREMSIPDSLAQRMALFERTGRVFKPQEDVFSENSWVQVMMGQGLMPGGFHNIAEAMSEQELRDFLKGARSAVEQTLGNLPKHGDYLRLLSKSA